MVCGPELKPGLSQPAHGPGRDSQPLTPAMCLWPAPWGHPPGCSTFTHMLPLGHPIHGLSPAPAEGTHVLGFA